MMPLRDAVPMTQCVSAEGAVTETGTQKFSVPVVTDSMLQLRAITMEDFGKYTKRYRL